MHKLMGGTSQHRELSPISFASWCFPHVRQRMN
jgi:hypothetical protein